MSGGRVVATRLPNGHTALLMENSATNQTRVGLRWWFSCSCGYTWAVQPKFPTLAMGKAYIEDHASVCDGRRD